MPVIGVSHGQWADPVAPPSGDDLFLVTRTAGAGGLVRVKANGTAVVLHNHGYLIDAGMGQSDDMFSDIYSGFAFRFAHSTDGGLTWTNAGVRSALPGEYVLLRSLVAGDVLISYARSNVAPAAPNPQKARVYVSDDGGVSGELLEEVTTAPPGASSGTHLGSVGEWATANASGIWWGVDEKDYATGETISHLRKTDAAGGTGTQISLAAHLSDNLTAVSQRGYANHDDSDSGLFHTTNPSVPADEKLFKIVGTTVTDLSSALSNAFDGGYDLSGSTLFVGSGGAIKKSTNGGGSFSTVFTPSASATKIRISQTNANVIVAMLSSNAAFCYSLNGGSTWTESEIDGVDLSSGIFQMVVY